MKGKEMERKQLEIKNHAHVTSKETMREGEHDNDRKNTRGKSILSKKKRKEVMREGKHDTDKENYIKEEVDYAYEYH